MADSRFFDLAGPLTLAEIAEICGAELAAGGDSKKLVRDVAPLDTGGADDLSFLDNKRYLPQFLESKAGACIVNPGYAARAPKGMSLLVTPKPYRAYALAAQAFYPTRAPSGQVHPTAVVDRTAKIGPGTSIEAHAVIAEGVEIGPKCDIGPNVVIEAGVKVGEGTRVGPNASLSHCLIGKACQIHAGARIGNRGFGFAMEPEGFIDVPQLGRVIIEDSVEIGANVTIDRGAGPDTVVGQGSKIDNLVQIGHNVQIGRHCVLVAQAGIAGSVVLEDYVAVGGQGGISGHLRLGKGAKIAAAAGVMRNVPPGEAVAGSPAIPLRDYFRLCTLWQRQLKARGKSDG
jgi:UDP-3-O-[3-hydroxymyristoyl] glucosamine N-acyltransferase